MAPIEYYDLAPTNPKYHRKDRRPSSGGVMTVVAKSVPDKRNQAMVVYPLWIVLMFV